LDNKQSYENTTIINKQFERYLSGRLACIDVLRGFDMFFLVGAGDMLRHLFKAFNWDALQAVQHQLSHVDWIGFTAWDIIMPLFLFTSGLSMPFSFDKFVQQGHSKLQLYGKILKRFCLLFLLGWILQGNLLDLDLNTFHVYCNTLHAIAFGYLITALIILNMSKISMQLVAGVSLLVVYWLLMSFVPVTGFGSGIFTPEGNLAIHIDHAVFGRFDDGTQYTWLLTSLGFGATVFSGYYAGQILRKPLKQNTKLKLLTFIGIALIAGGLLWSLQMPIIKKIWSCSMILFSSGICYLLLALSYLITDKWKIDSWWTKGFRMLGLNAIAAYMLYNVFSLNRVAGYWMHGLKQYTGDYYPFIVSLCQFCILFFIIRHMYKHRIFLKV
jgi:predicted acyltransferase